ncbi:MAG: IS1380 family transposase [Steroidobacteraceae bacterium]
MKTTPTLFEIEDPTTKRPWQRMAPAVVEASEDDVTGVAGIVLFGELLDHLGLVEAADRRNLRPIGPGGYTGGECYRPIVELQLAGGDFLSDVSLLQDEATQRLRGTHALPSHTTLYRFLAGAELGRVMRARATNRDMLRRAWAMGAAPAPGILTIDPDATYIDTYGKLKEGSTFSYKHEVQMSPLVGVVGETGDVLAIRARGGNASPRRKLDSFIDECVAAIPKEARPRYQLWVRVDSAGFSKAVVQAAEKHTATFSITCVQNRAIRRAIEALALDPSAVWSSAENTTDELAGAEVAETTYRFAKRDLRLIVRRQKKTTGEQLSFDDLGGWRFFALVTNAVPEVTAAEVDHHHRLRGGGPEEAIRQLTEDFGMNHAPLQSFMANWVWWLASSLAYNVARWVRVLALPKDFATCRGKRLRTSFFNVPAKVVRTARRLKLRLPRAYRHAEAFICALDILRALPTFA